MGCASSKNDTVTSVKKKNSIALNSYTREPASIQENKDTNASNFPLYVAKYDYDAGTDDDLSLRKGDYIFVISTEEGDWWYARNKETEKEGYVPSNYIAECQSLEAEE